MALWMNKRANYGYCVLCEAGCRYNGGCKTCTQISKEDRDWLIKDDKEHENNGTTQKQ